MKKTLAATCLFSSLLLFCTISGQSIAEKKASIHTVNSGLDASTDKLLQETNADLLQYNKKLQQLYGEILILRAEDAPAEAYKGLLDNVNLLRNNIKTSQEQWRQTASLMSIDEEYALWHQPDTTIKQLVIDYGSHDYVYLIPPSIETIKLSVASNLPIPRESWNEMLAFILLQNGIGIRQINPYLRELFPLENSRTSITTVTAQRSDLDMIPPYERICYVLTPKIPDPYMAFDFLSRFSSMNTTALEISGHTIFIVSTASEISELLKLYDFVDDTDKNKNYKLVTLTRASTEDIIDVLETIFHESTKSIRMNRNPPSLSEGLKIIPLSKSSNQAIFLFGSQEEIARAQDIIYDIENRIEGAQEKTVFVYTCKHSDAEELAPLIEKTYNLLVGSGVHSEEMSILSQQQTTSDADSTSTYKGASSLVINPLPIAPEKSEAKHNALSRDNFIVDPQTGAIIMVVERTVLSMLKDLLKKLDIPKKMIHIEVLLFEKKINDSNNFGLNILRLGSKASNADIGWASWSATDNVSSALDSKDLLSKRNGIFDFFLSRKKRGNAPSYDIAYNFLLSQRDITVHSSPSVTTINQTPASIKLVEEVSIDTGSITQNESTEKTYSRNQYGITIEITPTVHEPDEFDGDIETFITLNTNITFDDTPSTSTTKQPDITRRNIKNQVRIANGQTVILGGLRRKNSDDKKESLPFIGEIPGIGKLFAETKLSGSSTEMFVFITPTMISDSQEDMMRTQQQQLRWRPGDNTSFLTRLLEARQNEKRRLFEGSLRMLFGRKDHETPSHYEQEDDS